MSGNIYVGVNNQARKIKNIYVGVNGIARKVSNMYVGVNSIARKIEFLSNPISSGIMTVQLDLNNDDPTQWATYADDAVNMTAGSNAWDDFFGHYPCILENGEELGILNRNDFSKYEDGTDAPITTLGKDVMIAFPRMGYKISKNENILSVSMTQDDNVEGFSYMAHSYKGNACDMFYLGAYKAYISSGNLYSVSGQKPTAETIGSLRTDAQNRGIGYEQSAFYPLIFRQCMYLLKYKGQNAQVAIGRGFVDSYYGVYGNTGYTNAKGMDWGEPTGKYPMKLFGLEDFYGNLFEYTDGIYSNTDRQLLATDGNYNNSGNGYTIISSATASSSWGGFLKNPVGTNEAGFVPLISDTTYGTNSTYFCDNSFISNNRVFGFGGYYNSGDDAGVFQLSGAQAPVYVPNFGGRLMYMKEKQSS